MVLYLMRPNKIDRRTALREQQSSEQFVLCNNSFAKQAKRTLSRIKLRLFYT